ERETAVTAIQTIYRLRLPGLSPDRRAYGIREYRDPPHLSKRQILRTPGHGCGYPRPVPDRREKRPVPHPAVGRPATTRRHRTRADRQAKTFARRRADGEP